MVIKSCNAKIWYFWLARFLVIERETVLGNVVIGRAVLFLEGTDIELQSYISYPVHYIQ
jgi:hypothetical protein